MPGTTPGKQLSLGIISWSSNHEIIITGFETESKICFIENE